MSNESLHIEGTKRVGTLMASFAVFCVIIGVPGCASVVVQPEKPIQVQAPAIISVSKLESARNGTITLTVEGSEFSTGDVVEIYNTAGKLVGTGRPNSITSKHIGVNVKNPGAGNYTVKVKKPDGQYSSTSTITIDKSPKPQFKTQAKPQPTPQSSFTKSPSVLYLGGGDAETLFARYIAQNSLVELPYSLKIKFYVKKEAVLELQTVVMSDMEQLFIESREVFLSKIKKLLKGRVAEQTDSLVDDATREKADYLQYP